MTTVQMGAWYKHRATRAVMRCFAASSENHGNYVKLIDPEGYGKWDGYTQWAGSWDEFAEQWEIIGAPQG